jgi:hypothetical protein
MLFACRDAGPTAKTEEPPTVKPPAPKPIEAVSKDVAKSTPPIGPLVGAAPPTAARVKARSCTATEPVELVTAQQFAAIAAAFGPSGGLVAWSPDKHKLAVRTIDAQGKPVGEARELDVPAQVDRSWGVRALANHYLVFLGDMDYAGSSPIKRLYAVVVGKDGAPIGKPLQIAIGERGMIDDISPGAANGVLVYAGATPATNIKEARVITIHVAPDGAITQATRDFPDPTPGTRAMPRFAFSPEHAVIVLPEHVIVDGEIKPSKDDLDGLLVAPSFTGDKVPLIGIPDLRDAAKYKKGTLGLGDGTRTYDAKVSTGARGDAFDRVTWSVGSSDAGVTVTSGDKTQKLEFPGIPGGLAGAMTDVVWSGEQALVLFTTGKAVKIAPLPCN